MTSATFSITIQRAENGFSVRVTGKGLFSAERLLVAESEDKTRAIARHEFDQFVARSFPGQEAKP